MKNYDDLLDLHLFHQPIVNLVTGRLVGTEALLRLKTSEGYLCPNVFMNSLKDKIENLELFKWVLFEALNHKDFFKRCGYDIDISINITVNEMINPNFILFIEEIFSDFKNDKITFEITEDHTNENITRIPSVIKKLKDFGINTSIDDFGKELSNFDRLITYPVNNIKIDKMFVKNIAHSETYRDILQTMVDLSFKLNKKVIIEGIETVEQANIITDIGCHLAQGFGISKALHFKDLPIWITKSYSERDWWTLPNEIFNNIPSYKHVNI